MQPERPDAAPSGQPPPTGGAPPPTGGAPPPTDPDAPVCGPKFRTMLACVERAGAVNACTDKINDFLACERSVFRAAVRKTSARPEASAHARLARPPLPATPAPRAPDSAPDQPAPRRAPFDFFGAPLASLDRVVRKQIGACEALVESIGKPNYQTQLFNFNRRMLTDMRVTCEIVRSKVVQLGHRLGFRSRSGDQDSGPSGRGSQ